MAYTSFEEYKQAVLSANDLIDVGREYGLVVGPEGGVTHCPFHHDQTPSLSLRRSTQIFHCFGAGCGVSGDVIRLVERMDGLPFRDALDKLALRAGMAPYRASPSEITASAVERQIGEVMAFAVAYYRERLDAPSRHYFTARLPEAFIERFQVGTADGGLAAAVLHTWGPTWVPILTAAGLAMPAGREVRDRFYRRLILPLLRGGRPTSLTGRALDPDMVPKYLHPTNREAGLYNEDALAGGTTFVTEGPFDALALVAWEYPAVALQGGVRQSAVARLTRLTRVFTALDGDVAGVQATLRLAEALGDRMRVVPMPPGRDPSDLYRQGDRDAFARAVAGALDPVRFAMSVIPSPCPPEMVQGAVAPAFAILAGYSETSAAYYLEQVIAPRLGLTSKAGLKALYTDLQATRTGAVTSCPICRATLRRPPATRRVASTLGSGV